jgi:hypothetical protein
MSDHAPLYAVLILALGLGIVATPLVLLALLLFLTTQNAHSSKKSKGELQHPAAGVFHRDKDLDDPQPKQSRLPLSGRVLSDAFAGRNKADRQGNVDVLRAFSEDSGFRNRSTQF